MLIYGKNNDTYNVQNMFVNKQYNSIRRLTIRN